MKLTKIEKQQFTVIRKEIAKLATLDSVDFFDEFFYEDVENRVEKIDELIALLKQEKSMLENLED